MGIALLNVDERKRVCWSGDSAVDTKHSDINAYKNTMDLDALAFKAGEPIAWFTLKPLSSKQFRQAQRVALADGGVSLAMHIDFAAEAFKRGVIKVEGLHPKFDGDCPRGISEDLMDMLPNALIAELGTFVVQMSGDFSDPTETDDDGTIKPVPEADLKK